MQDLNNYYEDFFQPIEVAEGTFVEGVTRHISKVEANNPGSIYNPIISATRTKLTNVRNAISARDSEGTEQSGSTITMNNAMNGFISFVQIGEGHVKFTFQGKDSAEYKEFFPEGLSEYDNATLATIETLMDRMVTKATKYETQLGEDFKDSCIEKRQTYLDARSAQVTNIGETDNLRNAVIAAFKVLTLQLTTNVRVTGANNTDVPNAADIFFDQHFFKRPEATGIYESQNADGQTKTVRSQGWVPGKQIIVTNKGISVFYIEFKNADGVACSTTYTVASGATKQYVIDDIGYNAANHFLNITAITGGSGAKWKVEVL